MKVALCLVAIDPLLRGVLIGGGRGSGKTTIARAIQSLLHANARFVEAPPALTIDGLLGGREWISTLARGKSRVFRGLLETADGGVLFSDHVNLLPLATIAEIASALNTGIVRLERDGLASSSRTSFVWLATYDPDEDAPPPLLLDVLALQVEMDAADSTEQRESVAARALAFQSAPEQFVARSAIAGGHAEQVHAARQSLHAVSIDQGSKWRLCEMAAELGVVGNRAEIFAVRAARAHAALNGRHSAAEIDLRVARELVLEPRARAQASQARRVSSRPTPAAPRGRSAPEAGPAVIFEVPRIDNPAPAINWHTPRAGASDSGGKRARRRVETDSKRGRYVGSQDKDPGHGIVAVEATLRAAVPYQRIRQNTGRRVRVLPSDLRFKRFRRRTGVAIVFALDASGSMANNRIQQAKGAVIRLLREAYVHRDSVALVAFRGDRAELLMKLGRSVELAGRALDELPAGGGTPLAAGVLCALEEARRASCPTLLVLITDGRPNVSGTGEPVWEEIERVAAVVRQSKTVPIVIDTSRVRPGAEKVAALLGAQHLALPHMTESALYRRVVEAVSGMR